MAVVCLAEHGLLNCYQANTQKSTYGMLGHFPVHFSDQHPGCVCIQDCNNWKLIVNQKIQPDATVCRHLFTAESLYMFRASQRPSSGVLKTVTATSGIGRNTGAATSFRHGLIRTSPDQTMSEVSSCTSTMTYTRGSGYSF
jgi:hypothetical protein